MKSVNSFVKGAFILIGLFLVLSMSGGFARSVTAGEHFATGTFKTLQGRG